MLISLTLLTISYLVCVQNVCYCYDSADFSNLINKGKWMISSDDGNLTTTATGTPWGLYSALYASGTINDPLLDFNDDFYRWIPRQNFTASIRFYMGEKFENYTSLRLVFLGIDTVCEIILNNITIGNTYSMFVRYEFEVKHIIKSGANTLELKFESPIEYSLNEYSSFVKKYTYPIYPMRRPEKEHGENHVNHIRKMQASFGWDWGPSFPSVGVWQKVLLIAYNNYYVNESTILVTKSDTQWALNITAYLTLSSAEAQLNGPFWIKIINDVDKTITLQTLLNFTTVIMSKSAVLSALYLIPDDLVQKWWPNTYANPYPVKTINYLVTIKDFSTQQGQLIMRKLVGFKTVELIEQPITIPNGTQKGLSFYFKINGIPIFMKGANWIPPTIFPEDVEQYYESLLSATKEVNMNCLRVWGGGVYETNLFYEIASRKGILIWQDFMFACALYPVHEQFLDIIKTEITQQVRRLASYPAILIWAGNNENEGAIAQHWWPLEQYLANYTNDYRILYGQTIKSIVEQTDNTRPYVASSPSNGLKSEEDGWISENPADELYGDVHHYDYWKDGWDPISYPEPRFCSEYGLQAYPSLQTYLSAVSDPEILYKNVSFFEHRQHHPFGDAAIAASVGRHFVHIHECYKYPQIQDCDKAEHLKNKLLLSQFDQAMSIKTQTEGYRRGMTEINPESGKGQTMGALYWQLNNIWQAPSWASIEWTRGGQRWKPLHYFAKNVFANLLVSPRLNTAKTSLSVYIINDLINNTFENVTVLLSVYSWNNQTRKYQILLPVKIPKYASAFSVYNASVKAILEAANCDDLSCFFYYELKSGYTQIGPPNYSFLTGFQSAKGLRKPNITIVDVVQHSAEPVLTFNITLRTDAIAPFTWLDTVLPIAQQGWFSDNAFLFVSDTIVVQYFTNHTITPIALRNKLTITSLMSMYDNRTNNSVIDNRYSYY